MELKDSPIYQIHTLSHLLHSIAELLLRRDGRLNYAQYRVLVAVHEAGQTSVTSIARWLGITAPTSSHLCHRLQESGFLTIQTRADNLRTKDIAVTAKAIAALAELNPQLDNMFEDCFIELSIEKRLQFTQNLALLQKSLQRKALTC